MNSNQRQSILSQLEQFELFDLSSIAAEKYKDEEDLSKISLGNYSLSEFITLTKRIFQQLGDELEGGFWQMLPVQQNFYNDFASIDLLNDARNYVSYMGSGSFENAVGYLERFIYYQIINGFWDKSAAARRNGNEPTVEETAAKLDLLASHLAKYSQQIQDQLTTLNASKDDLQNFKTKKQSKLSEITNKVATARQQLTEITNTVATATNRKVEIDALLEAQKKRVTDSEVILTDHEKKLKVFNASSDTLEIALKGHIDAAVQQMNGVNEQYLYVESRADFIKQKQDEIVKLTGFAADSALGHSFLQRKEQLSKAAWGWIISGGIMMLASAAWVITVFTVLKASTGNIWADLFVNFLKASPAFLILNFIVRRYVRERNLQEEYAFKQAVAATLNAYADLIQREEDSDRRKMVMTTIDRLYSPPKVADDVQSRSLFFNSRHLTEATKNLSEAVKQLPFTVSGK